MFCKDGLDWVLNRDMIDNIKLVLDVQSGGAFINMWWSGLSLSVGGGVLILYGALSEEISWGLLLLGAFGAIIGYKIIERSR